MTTAAKKEEATEQLIIDGKPVVDEAAQAAAGGEAVVVDDDKNDATAVLQQQIEALRRSEKIAKENADRAQRERAEAIRQAQERAAEVERMKQDAEKTQADVIGSALAAAKAESEAAQRDLEIAVAEGDVKGQIGAQKRLARAEANIARLEDGKIEIEERIKNPPPAAKPDPVDNSGLPPTAKEWLRAHPEYMTDPRKNAKIQALHWDVLDEGHQAFSTDYFESLERHLGLREADDDDEQQEVIVVQQPKPKTKTAPVSAPVSRDAPGGSNRVIQNGQIRLTAAQVEAAKIAGLTPKEYAQQLQKLMDAKAEGRYTNGGN